jgi:predicted phage tail protein
MTFDQEAFASGLPQITYTIRGKKIPAIGAAWNSGLSWSDEPARILYDYLVNPTYGKGIDHSLIDAASFNSSAAYNTNSVPRTSQDPTGVPRYTTNAFIDPDEALIDNVGTLLVPMRAGIITGDKYKIIQDRPTAPLATTIDDDSIIGSITYLQANKRTLMNAIRARYPNKADPYNYQEDIAIVESATLQSATYDGVKLQKDLELDAVTDGGQAIRIATEEINQSRQSGVLEVTVDPSNLDLTVGDVVKFTNSTLGQTNKLYRVIKTVLRSDHTLELNLREYDAQVYWGNNQSIIVNNKNDTDH